MEIFNHVPSGLQPGDRVIAAMSGGVDSTAVALGLQELGLDVLGVTLRLHEDSDLAVEQAKRMAQRLGIPHQSLDLTQQFRQEILQYFYTGYQQGYTPSPCIRCNRLIKLQGLYDYGQSMGAKAVCTGHYVRQTPDGQIYVATDAFKDQSYFLWDTPKAVLDYCRFPLGETHKPDVYNYVLSHGFDEFDQQHNPHHQKESQDLCFANLAEYRDFFRKPNTIAGEIRHLDGTLLGHHPGLQYYTIGQRKGLGIGYTYPLYVIRLDTDCNQIIVGPYEALRGNTLQLQGVNILEPQLCVTASQLEALAQIRFNSPPSLAHITFSSDQQQATVSFATPVYAITKGQGCAIYRQTSNGRQLLAGGWID